MGNEGEHNAFLVKGKQVLFIEKCVKKGKCRILFSLFFLSGVKCNAQSPTMRKKAVENKDSIMPFKSRLAFKTNAVDWFVLLPNITAEFDLFGSPYKHYTVIGALLKITSLVSFIICLIPAWSFGIISVLLSETSIIWIQPVFFSV